MQIFLQYKFTTQKNGRGFANGQISLQILSVEPKSCPNEYHVIFDIKTSEIEGGGGNLTPLADTGNSDVGQDMISWGIWRS